MRSRSRRPPEPTLTPPPTPDPPPPEPTPTPKLNRGASSKYTHTSCAPATSVRFAIRSGSPTATRTCSAVKPIATLPARTCVCTSAGHVATNAAFFSTRDSGVVAQLAKPAATKISPSAEKICFEVIVMEGNFVCCQSPCTE